LKRNSQRLGEARGSEEVDRLAKVRLTRNILELVPEVASVENVERLKKEAELLILAKLEELRGANVQLREAVATFVVERQLVLVVDAGVHRVTIVVDAVTVNVASTSRENAIGTSRRHLKDWR